MCQPPCGGRNVDKGLSDGMECTVGEPSRFHGTVDGTLLVVFLDGTESFTETLEVYYFPCS